jgi:hypothetical protein
METHEYWRSRKAAEYIGLSESTLAKMRVAGDGPAYHRPPGSRIILYSPADLDAWVASGRRRSTSEAV